MNQLKLSETGQLAFAGCNNFVKITARDEQTGQFNVKNLPSSCKKPSIFSSFNSK